MARSFRPREQNDPPVPLQARECRATTKAMARQTRSNRVHFGNRRDKNRRGDTDHGRVPPDAPAYRNARPRQRQRSRRSFQRRHRLATAQPSRLQHGRNQLTGRRTGTQIPLPAPCAPNNQSMCDSVPCRHIDVALQGYQGIRWPVCAISSLCCSSATADRNFEYLA